MNALEELIKTKSELPISRRTIINVFITNTLLKDEIQSVLNPYDLSLEQFNVLRILRGQNDNPLNLQDIQERMVNKMSNTTRLVDKLILKQLAERYKCKKNRRKVEIFITKKGLETLKELDSKIDETENYLTSTLSANELEQLNQLLNKLRTNTKKETV